MQLISLSQLPSSSPGMRGGGGGRSGRGKLKTSVRSRRTFSTPSSARRTAAATPTMLGSALRSDILSHICCLYSVQQTVNPGTNVTDPNASTLVNVNIYLRTINDINDYKMVSDPMPRIWYHHSEKSKTNTIRENTYLFVISHNFQIVEC